jgi:hypothetical protein
MMKAPLTQAAAGPNPTDWGEKIEQEEYRSNRNAFERVFCYFGFTATCSGADWWLWIGGWPSRREAAVVRSRRARWRRQLMRA